MYLFQSNDVDVSAVHAEGAISAKDLNSSAKWITELQSAISTTGSRQIYLVTNHMPLEGYKTFVDLLKKRPEMKRLHFIFNHDRKYEKMALIYTKNLCMSIIRKGVLYTNVALSFANRNEIFTNSTGTITFQDRTMNYLSFNANVQTMNYKSEVGNIDYSATTKTGEQVMGIARIDPISSQLILDSTLSWGFPSLWSADEAATIPHAYVSVSSIILILRTAVLYSTVLFDQTNFNTFILTGILHDDIESKT